MFSNRFHTASSRNIEMYGAIPVPVAISHKSWLLPTCLKRSTVRNPCGTCSTSMVSPILKRPTRDENAPVGTTNRKNSRNDSCGADTIEYARQIVSPSSLIKPMRANCPGTKTYSGSRRTRNDISAGFHRCSQTTGSSVMRAADADATGGAISIDGAVKMGGLDIIRTRMRLRFSAVAQDAASLTNWLRMICSRRRQRCQVFMSTSAKNRRAPSGAAFQAFVL